MNKPKTISSIFFILLLFTPAVAQQEDAKGTEPLATPLITAGASAERVRFAAAGTIVQMRLQVYAANAQAVFDATSKGNVLDWTVQDGAGERLHTGAYLCVVTVKSLGGKLNQRLVEVSVQGSETRLRTIDPTHLTTAQQQEVGPVEADAAIVVPGESEAVAATVVTHNGEEGQITRGRGALSFRLGDFFSGKDSEQMRLTAEGNLGIGIAQPQARLDVDGFVRATQGIVFPDGSVQYSASRKTFGPPSQRPGQFQQKSAPGQEHLVPDISGTGTTGKISKWIDGPSGVLGDSLITEASGSIGINGSPNPNFKLDVNGTTLIRGSNPAFNLVGLRPAGNQWVFQTVDDDGRFRLFGQDNVNPGQERLTIKLDTGNVGIGATNPTSARLQVTTDSLDRHLYLSYAAPSLALGNNTTRSSATMNSIFALSTSFAQPFHFGVPPGSLMIANYGDLRGDIYLDSNYSGAGPLRNIILQPSSGGVGIGTTNPNQSKLQVEGGAQTGVRGVSSGSTGVAGLSSSGTGVGGISDSGFGVRGTSTSSYGVFGFSDSSIGVVAQSNTGNLIVGFNTTALSSVFRVENSGTVHAPDYHGLPDFAEEIRPSPALKSRLEPGDVLVAASDTDRSVTRSRKPYSTAVLGIYSTAPGFIGTENPLEKRSSQTIPMAVIGIVPCKVSAENGAIRRGDLLTTSGTPGHAMRCANPRRCSGAIVGKALGALDRGTGVIKVLVSLQ